FSETNWQESKDSNTKVDKQTESNRIFWIKSAPKLVLSDANFVKKYQEKLRKKFRLSTEKEIHFPFRCSENQVVSDCLLSKVLQPDRLFPLADRIESNILPKHFLSFSVFQNFHKGANLTYFSHGLKDSTDF